MPIKNEKGKIEWDKNTHLLYILFSIMKHYMIANKLTNIPCQVSDPAVTNCASLLSMIVDEEISPGAVGSQLWLQTDKSSFGRTHFRNLKIAMEVGLLCENNFNEVILESRSRMERNKHGV